MTDFKAWIAPEGAVVEPPVHRETIVDVVFSDGAREDCRFAHNFNWSTYGEGPHVVAYRVVEEYREPVKPREWWAVGRHLHDSEAEADEFRKACADRSGNRSHLSSPIIYVREVLE